MIILFSKIQSSIKFIINDDVFLSFQINSDV